MFVFICLFFQLPVKARVSLSRMKSYSLNMFSRFPLLFDEVSRASVCICLGGPHGCGL